ncbi:unnamed protein product [Spirodela intermedia]|uniref:Uncharacterized protein n=1 Tax=Spirodela intermedia TaxID=51605 RepID=A0A7I8JJZ0_SPIIN|nr:unnamed protein product [Spirodela intermedia]CAA6669752.1 unnamed protein product [Spirodela intermedia]
MSEEVIKIGSSNHLRQLSPDGTEKWQLAALQRLSPDEELDGGGARGFIFRFAQQEEALYCI